MELNLQRQTITINETVFHGTVEQPIECDALLPDYCPDIVKVLKCGAVTHVDSTSVSGGHLTVEGMAIAHVYYTSDQHQIRHTEYKIPFARQIEMRSSPDHPIVNVTPSLNYINCRAVNQRRIDIRGAISLAVKVTDRREQQFVSDAIGGGLQLRRDIVQATDMLGQNHSSFPLVEELDLGYGKPQIGSVIRSDSRVHVQDHKAIAGKVVVKGDFMLHILYQPVEEDADPEVMEYTLPLSQIVDCEAADEECVCDVEMMVLACDLRPQAGEDGEYRAFSLDAKLGASVTAHRHSEIPVAGDCYSTKYETGCKRSPVSFIRLAKTVNETIPHKVTLDLPEGVERVLDAWCDIDTMTWKQDADTLALDFKLTFSLFARMEGRECLYFEQQSDLTHTIPLGIGCDDLQFEPTCDVLSCAFNLVGRERIDLRCEVLSKGCVYCAIKREALSDITVDENAPRSKEQNKLYIYYADAGESVWSIAKHYNTSAGAIWEENALEDDNLPEKRMLLIPIV